MDERVRLELREWDMDFAVDIAAAANDPEVSAKLRDAFPFPYTVEAAGAFIKCVFEGNEASTRVLEKNGFQLEGILRRAAYKRGRVLDCRLYGLLKAD